MGAAEAFESPPADVKFYKSLEDELRQVVPPVPAAVGFPRFMRPLQRAGIIELDDSDIEILAPPLVPGQMLAIEDGELGPEVEVTDDSDGTVELARHDASDIESCSSEMHFLSRLVK